MNCGWWIRWYHRRLRQIDTVTLRPFLTACAYFSSDPDNAAERAWQEFILEPGQEHWRCRCAKREAKG